MSANISHELAFSAIFCDDIREEVTGKHSIIGAYGTHLMTKEFPVVIPRLGIVVRAYLPIGSDGGFKIRVERGGDLLLESDLPARNSVMPENWPQELDAPSGLTLDAKLMFSPIHFPSLSTLRVIVAYEGKDYLAGRLHVTGLDEKTTARIKLLEQK